VQPAENSCFSIGNTALQPARPAGPPFSVIRICLSEGVHFYSFEISNRKEKICLHIIHFEMLIHIVSTSVNTIFKIIIYRPMLIGKYILVIVHSLFAI